MKKSHVNIGRLSIKANHFLGSGQFEVREEAVPEIGAEDVKVFEDEY